MGYHTKQKLASATDRIKRVIFDLGDKIKLSIQQALFF
jgi:hypothetical protein